MKAARNHTLCIEDDRETVALIAEELTERGYEVTVAYDGQEGLTAILETSPDLVLADINMPGMSGFDLLERLLGSDSRFKTLPFMFLTALADRDNELTGWRLGADDYVLPSRRNARHCCIARRMTGVEKSLRLLE